MSRHNYYSSEIWCNALGREDQILLIECQHLKRDEKVFLRYKEVKELIKNPKKIADKMGKGAVRVEADVYELLSIFMRYDVQAKDFVGKPDVQDENTPVSEDGDYDKPFVTFKKEKPKDAV